MLRPVVISISAAILALVASTPARAALPAVAHAHHRACDGMRELDTGASGGARANETETAPSAEAIRDLLIGGRERWADALGQRTPPAPAGKQRQDAAFPAAFVFQSHSASYLAVVTPGGVTAPAARPRARAASVGA